MALTYRFNSPEPWLNATKQAGKQFYTYTPRKRCVHFYRTWKMNCVYKVRRGQRIQLHRTLTSSMSDEKETLYVSSILYNESPAVILP